MGSTMTDKTEAQPEALRLAESQRYSDVVHHANVKASLAYVARKTGLGYQETERLLELALQHGDLAEGDYSGRKIENTADDRIASLEAELVAQTNRAAAAEQQVTALTQRLDMANRLNTDAREELADIKPERDFYKHRCDALQAAQSTMRDPERTVVCDILANGHLLQDGTGKLDSTRYAQLSARQAAPDGWRLVPVASTAAMEWAFRSAEVRYSNGAGRMLPMDPHSAFKAQYRDMLSAAPPPPEREPLSETEVRGLLESAGYWPGEDAQRADFINGLRYCEMAHGIGATNDNP